MSRKSESTRAPGNEAAVAEPHEQIQYRRRASEHFDRFQIVWHRMLDNFAVELVAQDDDVLHLCRRLIFSAVPELRLA